MPPGSSRAKGYVLPAKGGDVGKAAKKQRKVMGRYLATVFEQDPQAFDRKWDLRLESWVNEIHMRGRSWRKGGAGALRQIFTILDNAMETLRACGPEIYGRQAHRTYSLLVGECCKQVADTVDGRLYRLTRFPATDGHGR
jgi:hypothetical protein